MKYYSIKFAGAWVRSIHFDNNGLDIRFHHNPEVAARVSDRTIAKKVATLLPGAKVLPWPTGPKKEES